MPFHAACARPQHYRAMWKESVDNPEAFWAPIADQFRWYRKVRRTELDESALHAR